MNSKTAKLIRQYAELTKIDEVFVKRAYEAGDLKQKKTDRGAMEWTVKELTKQKKLKKREEVKQENG